MPIPFCNVKLQAAGPPREPDSPEAGVPPASRALLAYPAVSHRGVTLVELLVVIAIISILASALLGVASLAGDTAREARTKNIITQLHTLLMEHYDTYKTRRVEPAVPPLSDPADSPQYAGKAADNRLLAIRELMRMEMPDRWSDLLGTSVENIRPNASDTVFNALKHNQPSSNPPFLIEPTALWSTYIRRYRSLRTNDPEIIRSNQGAECLYMVITLATADGEARSLFGDSAIGDTDNDGAPEFLDGWGNPIQFLRWAPGYESDLQLSSVALSDPNLTLEDVERMIATDHDPFDIYRRDDRMSGNRMINGYEHLNDQISAFRLVPLIFSAGPDEDPDIHVALIHVRPGNTWVDPYQQTSFGAFLGSPSAAPLDDDGENWHDNITNHLLVGE